jgi:phosphoribosylanthranilate isomerase
MIVRVKICGITRLEDALLGVDLGADALGFNFVEGSPRRLDADAAAAIAAALPPYPIRVGVFADQPPETVEGVARRAGMHCLQLHGDESPESCARLALPWYKAHVVSPGFRPEDVRRYRAAAFLLDGYAPGQRGGTGRAFDWSVARRAASYGRLILAGGLTPESVARAIAAARPFAVDVNSGVESAPGIKDRRLLEGFMRKVREASLSLGDTPAAAGERRS